MSLSEAVAGISETNNLCIYYSVVGAVHVVGLLIEDRSFGIKILTNKKSNRLFVEICLHYKRLLSNLCFKKQAC